jgi:hypothetical protein
MKRFIRWFTFLAASGFILSVVVHILALFNKATFLGWFLLLHFGVFVGLFGAVAAYLRLRRPEGKGFWKRVLRASLVWMRWVFLVCLLYSFANFMIYWNELFNLSGKSLDEIMAVLLRGFSGHWMLVYFGTFIWFHATMRAIQQGAMSSTGT